MEIGRVEGGHGETEMGEGRREREGSEKWRRERMMKWRGGQCIHENSII